MTPLRIVHNSARVGWLAAALALSAPVLAQTAPATPPAAILSTAPAGTRFGLLVVDDQGVAGELRQAVTLQLPAGRPAGT